jgi:hypothetical protein
VHPTLSRKDSATRAVRLWQRRAPRNHSGRGLLFRPCVWTCERQRCPRPKLRHAARRSGRTPTTMCPPLEIAGCSTTARPAKSRGFVVSGTNFRQKPGNDRASKYSPLRNTVTWRARRPSVPLCSCATKARCSRSAKRPTTKSRSSARSPIRRSTRSARGVFNSIFGKQSPCWRGR